MHLFKKFIRTLILIIGLFAPAAVLACIWDHDTLKMETARFPDTLELITGKFLRHSKEFYQWRIQDRTIRLKSDPTNLNLLDDLAVAYEKTENHEKAIEIALKMEAMKPERYETAANLGTFYLHAGKFKEGLAYIDKAIKINPEAHFGREKYQRLLVEYIIDMQPKPPFNLPIATLKKEKEEDTWFKITNTFTDFLREKKADKKLSELEIKSAIKGILGMMKFGNYNSPILLEALGFLLLEGDMKEDGKLLASRAFLKASYEAKTVSAKSHYQFLARMSLSGQVPTNNQDHLSTKEIEVTFQKELNNAKLYYDNLYQLETTWIKEGKNPETEFDKLYDNEPEAPPSLTYKLALFIPMILATATIIFVLNRKKKVAVQRKYKRSPITKRVKENQA